MAAKALLAAAGLLKRTATERATSASQSGGTATEHASLPPSTSQSGGTATEHASLPPSTGQPNTRKIAIEEDFYLEDEDVEKVVALLMWMSQDFQPDLHKDDIHHAVLELLSKHIDDAMQLLHSASVRKLSQLIDIMTLTKEGIAKDANDTLQFMRRVASFRWELLGTNGDNATEHVELDEDDVSKCYQRFGRELLTHDLLPHQKKDSKYRIRNKYEGDTYLSTFQRSFTDNMLRKHLGDKRVAFRIWQHGIPSIADRALPLRRRGGLAIDMSMLQSSLDECLQWYICLANDIVVHQTQEGFDAQLSASSKDAQERQQQQTRREALQKAKDNLRRGAALARQRDKGKRHFLDDMDEDEQKLLEDYDTGRAKRAKQRETLKELKPFRSYDCVHG